MERGISEEAPDAFPVRRVCVIGNSYVGAMYRAYTAQLVAMAGFEFSFFASAGAGYYQVGFADGDIVNTPITSGGSPRLADYDRFVLYGDAPTPRSALEIHRNLASPVYSAQLRRTALSEWLARSASLKLSLALRRLVDRPILVLSNNVRIEADRGDLADYIEGSDLLSRWLHPALYVAPPLGLYSDEGRARPELYSGSLNVAGVEPDRNEQPDHHHTHYNQTGGALVLADLVERLRKL